VSRAAQASEPREENWDEFNVCPFCGETLVTVTGLYTSLREFEVDVCCDEGQLLIDYEGGFAALPRGFWKRLFAEQTGVAVRQTVDALNLRLDWGLELRDITRQEAHAFVGRYHEHNEAPAGEFFCVGAYNGADLVSVACCGHPQARNNMRIADDGSHLVWEVTRLCTRRDLPDGLSWNASSMLYGEACRRAKRSGAERVITYTLKSESGHSLRASGFVEIYDVPARKSGWDTPSRRRDGARTPNVPKVCWERRLVAGLGPLNKRAAEAERRADSAAAPPRRVRPRRRMARPERRGAVPAARPSAQLSFWG